MLIRSIFVFLLALVLTAPITAKAESPVVLELFTSQGCSSCPPADALLKKLVENDPSIIALSYHVHFWDNLGWKDTYSSSDYTQRQRHYAAGIGMDGVFTPQMFIEGQLSVVGSSPDIPSIISKAKQIAPEMNVSIKPEKDKLKVSIEQKSKDIQAAEIWEIGYDHDAKTVVDAGENKGKTLESVNNVMSMKLLGTWTPKDGPVTLNIDPPADYGVAIIVQVPGPGRILGAASYINH